MLTNRLSESTSPYLLQHQNNPVHWQNWGAEALAIAQAENKPVLLSIGYAACHWCHVMAHESFEDPKTAELMNTWFVNIKVDREERPDIDAIYMNAIQLMGVSGGWPLTMFLTPSGDPFWGGTYFPPEPRYGQPAFRDVLQAVHDSYVNQPQSVEKNRLAVRRALNNVSRSAPGLELSNDVPAQIADYLVGRIDPVHGGLRGAPKFPHLGLLELMWRCFLKTRKAPLAHAVTGSLTPMCQGGLYDHLGGGFARYSVDERWLVPHFEKMLYDNAAFVDLLALVWLETRDPLFAARVEETVGFVLREMKGADGGFAASLDADSEGEEGRYYVWDIADVVSVLGRDAPAFCAAYDLREEGNFEGKTILNRLSTLEHLGDETEQRLASSRAKLFAIRQLRVRPGFDDKILADWNGLMISALVRAGTSLGRPDWIVEAAAAFEAVLKHLSHEHDGMLRLYQSYRAGRKNFSGVADGYANLARAALLLEEASGARHHLDVAIRLVESLNQYFWDEAQGGYFYSAADAEALIIRSRFSYDHPLPNVNGVMIEVLYRLYHRTGEAVYRTRAEALLTAFSGDSEKNVTAHAAFFNGLDFARDGLQITIIGRDPVETQKFRDAAFALSEPQKMIAAIAPEDRLPAHHPAANAAHNFAKTIALVCRGTRCSLPISEPGALREAASAL